MIEKRLYEEIFDKISKINDLDELDRFSKDILNIDVRITVEEKKRVSNLKTFIKNKLCKALMQREKEIVTSHCSLNLTKIFSKNLLNGLDIDNLPLTGCNRNIGVIPKVFLNKAENKRETSIKIFDLLADYSMKLNYDFAFKALTFENEKDLLSSYIKEFELEIETEANNNYIIKISDEEKAHKLLNKLISDGIKVDKFEIKKPTLNDIFIEKVGE